MLCKNSKENNTDMSRHGENMAERKLGNKNNYQTSVVSHFLIYNMGPFYRGHFQYDQQYGWLYVHDLYEQILHINLSATAQDLITGSIVLGYIRPAKRHLGYALITTPFFGGKQSCVSHRL